MASCKAVCAVLAAFSLHSLSLALTVQQHGVQSPNPVSHAPAIYTVFAGRKALLMMQELYWTKMVNEGSIKEVHLWDYTDRAGSTGINHNEDHAYVKELETKYDFVRVFSPNPERPRDGPYGGESYRDYYKYYAENPYEGVIIKADDDIVYVNTTMVSSYVRYLEEHKDVFLLSASVVNQGLCAYYQQKHGAIDYEYEVFPKPANGMGDLQLNGTQSLRLQKWFQQHPERFYVPGDVVEPITFTINVNFVALRGENMRTVHLVQEHQVSSGDRNDYYDEGALTWDAIRRLGKKEGVYMGLVVAHMGFSQQNRYSERQKLWEDYYRMNSEGLKFNAAHFHETLQLFRHMEGANVTI